MVFTVYTFFYGIDYQGHLGLVLTIKMTDRVYIFTIWIFGRE
jgi:hypothetical protein